MATDEQKEQMHRIQSTVGPRQPQRRQQLARKLTGPERAAVLMLAMGSNMAARSGAC
jgi:hypothetical protein